MIVELGNAMEETRNFGGFFHDNTGPDPHQT
jgi:hypothetical protein